MSSRVFLLILGMAAVTYIPRALPAVIIEKLKFTPRMDKFLRLIPYTAMAALIFPGVLLVDGERMYIGIVGGIIAGIAAWKKLPLMVSVIAAILANLLLYLIF